MLSFSDVRAARDQMNGAIPYPPLPLTEVAPRASSVFSQPSSACSSTHSFNAPFNGGVVSPQPHSSYYSGMTGPQHPFYNRVRKREQPFMLDCDHVDCAFSHEYLIKPKYTSVVTKPVATLVKLLFLSA